MDVQAYMTSNLVSVLFTLNVQTLSSGGRVQAGLAAYSLLLSLVLLLDKFGISSQQGSETCWKLTVVCVALVGISDGLCQPAIYGEAAKLPTPATQVRASSLSQSHRRQPFCTSEGNLQVPDT